MAVKREKKKKGWRRDRPPEVPLINQDPEFFDVFLPDRTSHQMIPPEFLKHFEHKIPKTVILKDLSGRVWHVDIKQGKNGVFMENGWNRFVNDKSLELGQFMVFRYSKQSTTFTVRIFGRDACKSEDQASEKPLIRVKEEEESDQESTLVHQPKRKRGKP
ncbi:AT hook, DNA-binding motif-containing protein [Artemisia annua]|uniref:AT hook, DNA-binding motif-containing protein n=1 Tax=Artemisia annua TaxID=35608 RepID=A0A2U1P5H1_ARTAN|nr:AT hook, DNA-binding motif-containing protein [Artemisia annua]